jgi:hypothetical protein
MPAIMPAARFFTFTISYPYQTKLVDAQSIQILFHWRSRMAAFLPGTLIPAASGGLAL